MSIVKGFFDSIKSFSNRLLKFIAPTVFKQKDKIATGKTIESLEVVQEVDLGAAVGISLYGGKSVEFINQGLPTGVYIPDGELLDWMNARGIPASAEKNIQWGIFHNGVEPVPIIDALTDNGFQEARKFFQEQAVINLNQGIEDRMNELFSGEEINL